MNMLIEKNEKTKKEEAVREYVQSQLLRALARKDGIELSIRCYHHILDVIKDRCFK